MYEHYASHEGHRPDGRDNERPGRSVQLATAKEPPERDGERGEHEGPKDRVLPKEAQPHRSECAYDQGSTRAAEGGEGSPEHSSTVGPAHTRAVGWLRWRLTHAKC